MIFWYFLMCSLKCEGSQSFCIKLCVFLASFGEASWMKRDGILSRTQHIWTGGPSTKVQGSLAMSKSKKLKALQIQLEEGLPQAFLKVHSCLVTWDLRAGTIPTCKLSTGAIEFPPWNSQRQLLHYCNWIESSDKHIRTKQHSESTARNHFEAPACGACVPTSLRLIPPHGCSTNHWDKGRCGHKQWEFLWRASKVKRWNPVKGL